MSKKKPLTPEESEECRKLSVLFSQSDATQKQVIELLDVSQGAVSSYLHGRNKLNLRAAIAFAQVMGVQISEFSPRLYNEQQRISSSTKSDIQLIADQLNESGNEELMNFAKYLKAKQEADS